MAKEIKKGNYDFDSAYKPFNYEKTPSFIDVIFAQMISLLAIVLLRFEKQMVQSDMKRKHFLLRY